MSIPTFHQKVEASSLRLSMFGKAWIWLAAGLLVLAGGQKAWSQSHAGSHDFRLWLSHSQVVGSTMTLAAALEETTVGFPRYAQRGGCTPNHGATCRQDPSEQSPDMSVPPRIENQKRLPLAQIQKSESYRPRLDGRPLIADEPWAARGQLDVLERPPRFDSIG